MSHGGDANLISVQSRWPKDIFGDVFKEHIDFGFDYNAMPFKFFNILAEAVHASEELIFLLW